MRRSRMLAVAVVGLLVAGMVMPATAFGWYPAEHAEIDNYAIGYAALKSTFADDFRTGEAYIDALYGPYHAVVNPSYHFNTASTNPAHNHTVPERSGDIRLTRWSTWKANAQSAYNGAQSYTRYSSDWYFYMHRAAYYLGMASHPMADVAGHGQIGKFCHFGVTCTCNTMRNIIVDSKSVGWGGYTGAARLSLSKNRVGQLLYGCRSAMPLLFN